MNNDEFKQALESNTLSELDVELLASAMKLLEKVGQQYSPEFRASRVVLASASFRCRPRELLGHLVQTLASLAALKPEDLHALGPDACYLENLMRELKAHQL